MPDDKDIEHRQDFENYVFREISYRDTDMQGNIIKAANVHVIGNTKVEVQEESLEGIKIILKKDESDTIREIKFICSCGQTKTIVLDYPEE